MKKIKIFKSRAQELELLEKSIKQKAINESSLRILEAGCGQKWLIDLGGLQYTLTGVDTDKNALEFRKTKIKDLDEIILGDLHSVDIEENAYDVIYSSFVLEHIQNAEQVLNNFSKWLKPDGILILRIPDRNSVYGFITRITPFRLHVFLKKYVFGFRNAGKPGFGPYPTFHEFVVSREGIHKFCEKNHFIIKEEYGDRAYIDQGFSPILIRLFVITVSLLSLGKLQWKYINLTYVLEKQWEA